jgi:hypothetical protein
MTISSGQHGCPGDAVRSAAAGRRPIGGGGGGNNGSSGLVVAGAAGHSPHLATGKALPGIKLAVWRQRGAPVDGVGARSGGGQTLTGRFRTPPPLG